MPPSADFPETIAEIKKYIRRQRNLLLDGLHFYNRRQQRGESFDSFMTALKELFGACDFSTMEVCSSRAPKLCKYCPDTLNKANEDILRDRIVVGVHEDDTRHKLLAHENLRLMDAVICRSEKAAKHAGDAIPLPAGSSPHASVNAVKCSTCQCQKQTTQSKSPSDPVSYVILPQLWSWTSFKVGLPSKWQEMHWLQAPEFSGVLPEEEEIAAWL